MASARPRSGGAAFRGARVEGGVGAFEGNAIL